MATEKEHPVYNLILVYASLITIVITPWVNKDSMIIPKLILILLCAMYLIPKIVLSVTEAIKLTKFKILLTIIVLIILQIIIVTLVSSAPFEQEFFGRTGRGLGVITYVSLVIVVYSSAIFVRIGQLNSLLFALSFSCLFSSSYALFQSFGIDFIKWDSKTNGVIGTLGNPNFQSSFAAMGIVPVAVYFWNRKSRWLGFILSMSLLGMVIFKTQSTQGYIAVALSIFIFAIIFYWYRKRLFSYLLFFIMALLGFVAVLGMLNKGPLSYYLYKISVQSRGDFWRSALNAAEAHPFFGVGIDSFGDSYLKYRDTTAISHSWTEYTDNAHNFFLQYAVTAGYFMAILQLSLVVLTLICFIQILGAKSNFDPSIVAVFTSWLVFQVQSFISPGNLPMMFWNAILTGTLIGVSVQINSPDKGNVIQRSNLTSQTRLQSYSLVLAGLFILYPLFNTDRLQLQAMSTGNGDLAISSAQSYPESVVRYQVITRELLNSNLLPQALSVARSAVKFNPNSPNLWALILINPTAPLTERVAAKAELLKLDPLNQEVINYFVE
jgi:O-antigen ligase